jgi:hypothetical protein
MGQDEGPRQQAAAGGDDDGSKPLGISFCGGRWVTSGEGQPAVQLAAGSPLQQVPEFGARVPPNPFLERADTMDAFSKSAVLERSPSTPSMSRLPGMASGDKERNPSMWRMSGIAGAATLGPLLHQAHPRSAGGRSHRCARSWRSAPY